MVSVKQYFGVSQASHPKSVVEPPTAGVDVLLHAKDEMARLKAQLKTCETKEKEVTIALFIA